MTRISIRTNTQQTVALYVMDCANCGLIFAVNEEYDQRRRSDGKGFYCPNGHSLSHGETDTDRAKKEAARLRTKMLAEMDQRRAAENEAAKAKASEIRIRWRVGNGVCPCCSRTFPGLAAHVAAKHPEFLTHDLTALSTRQIEHLAALRRLTEERDSAVVEAWEEGLDWRSIRALARRSLVEILDRGQVALTATGWPLAEQAAATEGETR